MTDPTDDPIYRAIKARVIAYDFAQGERIYIEPIAEQMGLSTWPVRQVFDHLAVEGLVVKARRKGFYALTLQEDDLVGHYQLTRHILSLGLETLEPTAVRTMHEYTPIRAVLQKLDQRSVTNVTTLATYTGQIFASIATVTGRSPLIHAISRENDHLHYVRTLECQRIENVQSELMCFCELFLAAECKELITAIRDYHSRRLELLPELIEFLRK